MTYELQSEPSGPSVGACAPCRAVFYIDSDAARCPFCAGPPSYTLPFSVVDTLVALFTMAESADLPPAAAAPPFGAPEAAAGSGFAPAAAPGPSPSDVEPPASGIPVGVTRIATPDAGAPPAPSGPAEGLAAPPPPGGTVANYDRRLILLSGMIGDRLAVDEPDWRPLRAVMGDYGAEEEEISTAVGRLDAVHNFIHDLAARGLGDARPEPEE